MTEKKSQPNIFKNSGIRGKANNSFTNDNFTNDSFTNDSFLNPNNMTAVGYALGEFKASSESPINILIANDTRTSAPWIKKHLLQGFSHFDHHVFDAGIVPTPFIAKALKNATKKFHLGIMITASHNPPEFNGVKVMLPTGYLTKQDEERISKSFYKYINGKTSHKDNFPSTPKSFDIISSYESHIQKQLNHLPFKNVKVVLDCANGATYKVAEQMFKACGFNTVVINNSNDGNLINVNSGCNNPQLLVQAVQKHNADWGCAFDGDGDRIIIVDNNDTVFDGDDLLILLSQHPSLKNETTFVGTIMSNKAIENHLTSQHKKLIRTQVGERNLIEAFLEHNAQLGSEPCGHITIANHALCSDGIFAALMFFDTLFTQDMQYKQNYKKFPQVHATINLENKSIDNATIKKILQAYNDIIQPGRVIARRSDTEPVLRIMVEHENKKSADKILTTLKEQFLQQLT